MKIIPKLIIALFVWAGTALHADSREHIADLASRYDLVGVVTHTSVFDWNTNRDRSVKGKLAPLDPNEVPNGVIYVGLGEDDPSSGTPYFADIYVKGRIYGYNEWFVRVFEVKGSVMYAMDQNGNEFSIKIIKRGSGYRRR
tara:strand:- start:234 stop:656 length:423 start_codon:yes stop_codon:yes gene_type:complete